MSMTVTWKPRWAVHVDPGDTLRISATYDTAVQSTYEDMGISIAMLAPDDPGPALDPFTATHDSTDGCPTGGADPIGANVLCEKGSVTHGHLAEAGNYGGPDGGPLPTKAGPQISQI